MKRPQRIPLFALLLAAAAACHGGNGTPAQKALASIAFQTRQEIPTAARKLRALLARDFTRDGIVDVVVTSLADRRVRLLVASSPGSFSTTAGFTATYPTPPGQVASADFDNDGDPDFAVLFETEGVIRVFRNDGRGRFREDASPVRTGPSPTALVALDLDRSGHGDLAVAGGSAVRLFFAQGVGFRPALVLPGDAGSDFTGLWGGDLNGDGRPDLVATDGAKDRLVAWYQGTAGFDPGRRQLLRNAGKGPVSVVGADVTSDGIVDLVVADFGSGDLSVLPGNGKGNFNQPILIRLDGDPVHVCVGDLYADGRDHLVVSYVDRASIGVVRNLGAGRFGAERQFGTSGLPTMCQVVDVDADGGQDVLTSGLESTFLSWFRGAGKQGLFGSENFAPGGHTPNFTVSADLDGDGNADALVSDRDGGICSVLRGGAREPTGALGKVLDIPVGKLPGAISKGDFDRDGRVDAIVAVAGGIRFLLNRSGPGGFAFDVVPNVAKPPFGGGVGPFEAVCGRFDGDEFEDLAVADFGGDKILVHRALGPGFGFEAKGRAFAVAGGPLSIVKGDFNGDGKLDLAVSRFRDGFVTVLAGDGGGSFAVRHVMTAGDSPNYLRAADFDGNGLDDLVVSNLGGDHLTLFLAETRGFRTSTLEVGDGPTALLARDLNRDGKADILVANADSADFHVLLGDGKGSFPAIRRFPGTFRAISADLGDSNGDGLDDLVVASLFTNRISLYVNRSK